MDWLTGIPDCGVLNCVLGRHAWFVEKQPCWNKCLTGMLVWVFNKGAGLLESQRDSKLRVCQVVCYHDKLICQITCYTGICWIECVTGNQGGLIDKNARLTLQQGYWTVSLARMLDLEACWSKCLTGVLEEVFERDAPLSVWQHSWIQCSRDLDQEFDRNAALSNLQGCSVKWLRGMLDWVFDRDAELSQWYRCLRECFTEMPDWLIDRGAGWSAWQECWLDCVTGMLEKVFHRAAGVSSWMDASLCVWQGC